MGNSCCNDATVATVPAPHRVGLQELRQRFHIKNHTLLSASYVDYQAIYESFPETFNFFLQQEDENGFWTVRLFTKDYVGSTSATCDDMPMTIREYCESPMKPHSANLASAFLGLNQTQFDFFFAQVL